MNINEYIDKFREENGRHPHGFCYIFARILQVNFWGVIYATADHCVLRHGIHYFDIDWMHEYTADSWFLPIDELTEARYKNYENFLM